MRVSSFVCRTERGAGFLFCWAVEGMPRERWAVEGMPWERWAVEGMPRERWAVEVCPGNAGVDERCRRVCKHADFDWSSKAHPSALAAEGGWQREAGRMRLTEGGWQREAGRGRVAERRWQR